VERIDRPEHPGTWARCACPGVVAQGVRPVDIDTPCWSCKQPLVELEVDMTTGEILGDKHRSAAPAPPPPDPVSSPDQRSVEDEAVPRTHKELLACARELLGYDRAAVVETTVRVLGPLAPGERRSEDDIALVWWTLVVQRTCNEPAATAAPRASVPAA
jgi:hypothetical protein